MTTDASGSSDTQPLYEVRELNGQLRYQGEDEQLARTIYGKYAALGTPLTLTRVQLLEQSDAYREQRARLTGVVPWAR